MPVRRLVQVHPAAPTDTHADRNLSTLAAPRPDRSRRSRLAALLLSLAACTGVAEPPPTAPSRASPSPAPSPVPADSPPPPAPPRALFGPVDAYTLLADVLLISPRSGGRLRLDPVTGNTTPWSVLWSPQSAGWRLQAGEASAGISCDHPQASPDGRWIATACMFEPRPDPPRGLHSSAILVARPDGSEPRCLGVGLTTDEFPPFTWLPDRLLGDWSFACDPGPRGRLRELPGAPKNGRSTRWWHPADDTQGTHPFSPDFRDRDPQGHLALVRFHRDSDKSHGLDIVDLQTGTVARTLPETAGQLQWNAGFVAPDAVLVNLHVDHKFASQRLEFVDGRSIPPPAPTWRHYARLPNGEHLFTRDSNTTLEQGRVDWPNFKVESSRPRPDLQPYLPRFDQTTYTTFAPALGGLLIHDPRAGTLALADL